MKKRPIEKGEILFQKGCNADSIYYITKGTIKLIEIDRIVKAGEIIGEIGIFSPYKARTQTAECLSDGETYVINSSKIMQLYYQNPTFGYYLIQLVIKRFIDNLGENAVKAGICKPAG
jgi:CRP-like cAMP-binding protein